MGPKVEGAGQPSSFPDKLGEMDQKEDQGLYVKMAFTRQAGA